MATQPTNKPIGSEDPRDLKFNAGKVDEWATSSEMEYTDRKDVKRLTAEGMQKNFNASQADKEERFNNFLLSSGYVFLGDYELGPWQFSERNQYIRYDGQYWRLAANAPQDFATTGITMASFEVDKLSLVAMDGDALRQDLSGEGGHLMIGGFSKNAALAAGVISAAAFGVKSGVSSRELLQELQDLSEETRLPINFSGISDVAFHGRMLVGDYFNWVGSGKNETIIRPRSLTRDDVGTEGYVYAWFQRKDPTKDLSFALLQDIGFDGQYQGGYSTPLNRLIRGFCWHAHNEAVLTDITALRCHFKNMPHEAWEGYTTGGGRIDGIRYLFSSSEGEDPHETAVGFNAFKCMNGNIDSPGQYGQYTITNIVSFDNVAKGHRTMNDFKRGCENWSISECNTYDMNDCHHSTDGSRNGTFSSSNRGEQLGGSRATKNYLEIQGEDIDVYGAIYSASKDPNNKAGSAGIFVTDYEYPYYGGDGVGLNRRQSVRVNIHSADITGVNHQAIRMINVRECTVSNVMATNCLYGGVSFTDADGAKDTDTGVLITSSGNTVGRVQTKGCSAELWLGNSLPLSVSAISGNEYGSFRLVSDKGSSAYSCLYNKEYINVANRYLKTSDYMGTLSATKTDYAGALPLGVPYAFTLEDKNNLAIQTFESIAYQILSPDDRIYVAIYVIAGSSTSAAIIFEERNGSSLTGSTFVTLNPSSNWSNKKIIFKPINVTTDRVVIKIAPACYGYNDHSLLGTTSFADFRVSKYPL